MTEALLANLQLTPRSGPGPGPAELRNGPPHCRPPVHGTGPRPLERPGTSRRRGRAGTTQGGMTMALHHETTGEPAAAGPSQDPNALTDQQLQRLAHEIEGAKFSIDCVATQGRALCKALLALLPTTSSLAAAHSAANRQGLDGEKFSSIRHSITHGRVLLEETMYCLFDQIDSCAIGDLENVARKLREHTQRSRA